MNPHQLIHMIYIVYFTCTQVKVPQQVFYYVNSLQVQCAYWYNLSVTNFHTCLTIHVPKICIDVRVLPDLPLDPVKQKTCFSVFETLSKHCFDLFYLNRQIKRLVRHLYHLHYYYYYNHKQYWYLQYICYLYMNYHLKNSYFLL